MSDVMTGITSATNFGLGALEDVDEDEVYTTAS
jgi:hypothetical protein